MDDVVKYTIEEALEYHTVKRGKLQVLSKTPLDNKKDLSLAYSPGVAEPCRDIAKDTKKVYQYTNKGNAVAVVTDGTAVLGLGDIGPEAGFPVMEGKAVLFKMLAGVDAYPICLQTKDADEIVETVKFLEPSFGGINLEDISAPRCFDIEKKLKEDMDIPVFHDDQHGTAIVTLAGLINALKIVGKKMGEVKIVFNGAGASGIACAKFYMSAGVKDVIICDSKGVIYDGREVGMNPYKEEIAKVTNGENMAGSLEDAIKGADIFVGMSVGNVVTEAMVKSMADDAIVFACANPDPEIKPEKAEKAGARVVATGRSDYPNQINNVLGFPGIFRGALDVQASDVNEEMKLAAAHAIASIIEEDRLDERHIITNPLNPEVMPVEAAAVARAAMESGVARKKTRPEEVETNTRMLIEEARKVFNASRG
ncbi:MAG: NAD-dependent malic enzyme [Candidatus Altiarchaeales archaeon]|nr:NAD-dependent malic enzyme [Candidatus Altiarchaeales archaeon]MBD3416647.1 NAD-dependent malic enzyme [Candidatus Altiarchaeales archaeon]